MKKVKPVVSSLIVEKLVSADFEVALSALASLADGKDEDIADFFTGNTERFLSLTRIIRN